MSNKDPKIFLAHILDSAEEIERNTSGISREDFLNNTVLQDAVARRLEIIGEATKNLSGELKQKYPDIEWRKIAGLRDVIVHEYFGLSMKLVWGIVEKDLPKLKSDIKKVLENEKK